MNENLDPTNHNFSPEELDVEKRLRPLSFDDFTGQDQVLENLKIFVHRDLKKLFSKKETIIKISQFSEFQVQRQMIIILLSL